MTRYVRFVDKLNKFVLMILSVCFAIMVIAVFSQVISRSIFDNSTVWSEELSRYLMIYIIFMGAGIAVRKGELISIDFVSEILKGKAIKVQNVVLGILVLIFSVIVIVQGFQLMGQVSVQQTPALQISMAIPYAGIVIGFAVMVLNTVAVIIEQFQRKEV